MPERNILHVYRATLTVVDILPQVCTNSSSSYYYHPLPPTPTQLARCCQNIILSTEEIFSILRSFNLQSDDQIEELVIRFWRSALSAIPSIKFPVWTAEQTNSYQSEAVVLFLGCILWISLTLNNSHKLGYSTAKLERVKLITVILEK